MQNNYSHAIIDRFIKMMPNDLVENEDIEILVSNTIYDEVKDYLVNERYKGFLIYTMNDVPEKTMHEAGSKYHD